MENDAQFTHNFEIGGATINREGNITYGVGRTEGGFKHGSIGINHEPSGLQVVMGEIFDENDVWTTAFVRFGLKNGANIAVMHDGTILFTGIPSYPDENAAQDDANLRIHAPYRVGGDLKIKF